MSPDAPCQADTALHAVQALVDTAPTAALRDLLREVLDQYAPDDRTTS
jgi:hypothetical protein